MKIGSHLNVDANSRTNEIFRTINKRSFCSLTAVVTKQFPMYRFFPWGQLTSSDFLLAIRVILVFLLDRQAFPRKEKYSEQRRTLPNVLTTKVVVPSQKAPTTIMKSQNTPMTSPTATQTGTMIRRCIHRTLLMTRVLNGAARHRAVRHNTQTSLTR